MCIAVYYISTVAFIPLLTYFLSPLSSHLLFSLPSPFSLFSSSFSTSSFPLPPLRFLLLLLLHFLFLHSTSSLFSSSFSLFAFFSSSFSTSSSFIFFIYHLYCVWIDTQCPSAHFYALLIFSVLFFFPFQSAGSV